QAAAGLVHRLGLAELAVQLVPVALGAQLQRHLARHVARDIKELENLLLAHGPGFGIGESGFGKAPRANAAHGSGGTPPRVRFPIPDSRFPALITPPCAARVPAPRGSPPSA